MPWMCRLFGHRKGACSGDVCYCRRWGCLYYCTWIQRDAQTVEWMDWRVD